MQAAAIVVAAGQGARLGALVEKPYVPVAGRPLLAWTLEQVGRCRGLAELVLVVSPTGRVQAEGLLDAWPATVPVRLVAGGATRADSVAAGLRAVRESVELVLVHDGVRPLASAALMEQVLETAGRWGAATAGLPLRATVKEVDAAARIVRTVARDGLWEVQTPQAFRRAVLLAAYAAGYERGVRATDDAAYVEQLGQEVRVVPGSVTNIKVTVPDDVVLVDALLQQREREGLHASRHRV